MDSIFPMLWRFVFIGFQNLRLSLSQAQAPFALAFSIKEMYYDSSIYQARGPIGYLDD